MYDELLLDHNTHPVYRGKLEDADVCAKLNSASCGDKLTIYLKFDGDKVIDGRFDGVGCAVSQASADLMLELIIGKSKSEIKELEKLFTKMLSGAKIDTIPLEDSAVFESFSRLPARVKCAGLPWKIVESW